MGATTDTLINSSKTVPKTSGWRTLRSIWSERSPSRRLLLERLRLRLLGNSEEGLWETAVPLFGRILIPLRRVPFTDEDDQILLNWINRPQIALSGNKVYKELEARVCLQYTGSSSITDESYSTLITPIMHGVGDGWTN